MAYEICKECGRFFEKNGRFLCNNCYDKDEEMIKSIKDLASKQKGITVIEVIKATGVSMRTLNRYIREGILEYASPINKVEPQLDQRKILVKRINK